jgi:hypothetical protein
MSATSFHHFGVQSLVVEHAYATTIPIPTFLMLFSAYAFSINSNSDETKIDNNKFSGGSRKRMACAPRSLAHPHSLIIKIGAKRKQERERKKGYHPQLYQQNNEGE